MIERGDYAKAILTGLGLAFGLGWLWFPWLGAIWLPGLLWGDSASGGGGAFLLLLILGFGPGSALAARILSSKGEAGGIAGQLLFAHGRRLCHIAAYLLLLSALLLRLDGPRNLPGIWPYIAMPAAVMAYAVMGLYWGGRLVSLPAPASAPAFFVAVVGAAIAGQALSLLSMRTNLILWPHSIFFAAVFAEILAGMETPQPKSRGRPAKKETEPACPPLRFFAGEASGVPASAMALLAAALASIGFTDGAAWALHAERIALPPAWLTEVSFGLGAFVPVFLLARFDNPDTRGPLSALAVALGTLAAAIALFWSPSASGVFQCFAEGAVSAVGLCLLADANAEPGTAVRRAGLALAACVLAMNAGRLTGDAVSGTTGAFLAVILAAAVSLALFWSPLVSLAQKIGKGGPNETPNPDSPLDGKNGALGEGKSDILSLFTEEEARIVELLAQEGLSNQEIATRLFVTRSTIRYHLKKIYAKTKTSNREELAEYLVREFGRPGRIRKRGLYYYKKPY